MKHIFSPVKLAAIVITFLIIARPAWTCGPFFPNSILEQPRKVWLLSPVAAFRAELENEQLIPHGLPDTGSDLLPRLKMLEADVKDLDEALQDLTDADRKLVEARYRIVRAKISHLAEKSDNEPAAADPGAMGPDESAAIDSELDALTELGVPIEFTLYLRGASRWRLGNQEESAKAWNALLELPTDQRHYRSTWAAYMLAKQSLENDTASAHEKFDLVRRLAAGGFADSLKMASDSDGWEGLAFLNEKNYAKAFDSYLKQKGARTAIESLRIVSARALDQASDDELVALAADERSRKVIAAFLISGGLRPARDLTHDPAPDESTPDPREQRLPRWSVAVENAGVVNEQMAERLALAEYQNGDMKAAQKWIHAAPRSLTVQWLQAKLHFYNGEIDEAAAVLRTVSRNLPGKNHSSGTHALIETLNCADNLGYDSTVAEKEIFAELGAIELNQKNFVAALDAFMKAEYWQDAAYVAERVLGVEELKSYVDDHFPSEDSRDEGHQSHNLRSLLARRLMRLNRLEDSRPYFDLENQAILNTLITHLLAGSSQTESPESRADALFRSAILTRKHGMELLGTELEPDWSIYGGNYDLGSAVGRRKDLPADNLPPSESEIVRTHDSEPPLMKRFHYRYTASEIGWLAALLMPNNDNETARVLCESGSWIKYLDPPRADKFYKSLVRRCRTTEIGTLADQMRWFPVLDENGTLKLKARTESPAEIVETVESTDQ